MKKYIDSNETEISGHIKLPDGRTEYTEHLDRIHWLSKNYLTHIADGNWTALYRDQSDDRYWEYSYPLGYMHGGGPPSLHCISIDEASERYTIVFKSE